MVIKTKRFHKRKTQVANRNKTMKGGSSNMPHKKLRPPKSWEGNAPRSHSNLKLNISHPFTQAHIKKISPYSITFGNKTINSVVLTNSTLPKNLVRMHINAQARKNNPNKPNISIAEQYAQHYRNTERSKLQAAQQAAHRNLAMQELREKYTSSTPPTTKLYGYERGATIEEYSNHYLNPGKTYYNLHNASNTNA
jgi:hypothetical protein